MPRRYGMGVLLVNTAATGQGIEDLPICIFLEFGSLGDICYSQAL